MERELPKGVDVRRNLAGSRGVSFALAFVIRHADVDSLAKSFARADGDAIVWFAYPKTVTSAAVGFMIPASASTSGAPTAFLRHRVCY